MSMEKIDRRQFIQQAGAFGLTGVAALGGLVALGGCSGEKKAEQAGAKAHNAVKAAQEAADPCNDLTTLTEDELATRTNFEYETKATDETLLCKTCNFWQPSAEEELCGTCTLMKGPIHPLGSCISWAEKIKT